MGNSYARGSEPRCPHQLPGCNGVIRLKGALACRSCDLALRRPNPPPVIVPPAPVTVEHAASDVAPAVLGVLKKAPATLQQIAASARCTPGQALDAILGLQAAGVNVQQYGEQWSVEKKPVQAGRVFEYESRPDHTFLIGVCSDNHLGSKYERLDVLNDLYDWFASEGVDRVLNSGNWIDGEDEKNRQDLAVHGLEPQIDYFLRHYPKREGLHTYAVWGEDHEGWFARRESIDIGRFVERKAKEAGRDDWHDLGFMEGAVQLVNADSHERSNCLVMHPGGGTAYALSYRPQKLVESLQGGEKPAVILIGHYHKISLNLIRSVWAVQVGCTQDQTPFMRKIPTEPHIGGWILKLTQDPRTGAIVGCRGDARQYFNKSYYGITNDRWSKSGAPVMPDRGVA